MKNKALIFLILTGVMMCTNAFPASPRSAHAVITQAQGDINPYQEMRGYIVGFKDVPNPDIIPIGGSIKYVFTLIRAIAANLTSTMADVLRSDTRITYVEEDLGVSTSAVSTSTSETETLPWGVDRIDAESARLPPNVNGSGVNIAVLDSGIDTDHPDLKSNYKGGFNFINSSAIPEDDSEDSHGTHVCGTIAAAANGIGVIGVAPMANLYAVKIIDSKGNGSWANVIAGIQWAVDHNMKIISMSLGGAFSTGLKDACEAAYNEGVLLVAAAGNLDMWGSDVHYPAKYSCVIAVSATNQTDRIAWFSCHGIGTDLCAPGQDINSTAIGGGYKVASGTSMACPHVTGTAALIWSANPSMTNVQVGQRLNVSAEDLGVPGWDPLYGNGLVDAEKSVAQPSSGGVGGFWVAADKVSLLFPYIGLASAVLLAAIATTVYVKRVKHRKEKQ